MKAKKFSRAKFNPMASSLRNHKPSTVRSLKNYNRKKKHKSRLTD